MPNLKAVACGPVALMCPGIGVQVFAHRSCSSKPIARSQTVLASLTFLALMAIQSRDKQAGVTPRAEISPRIGLKPTTPLNPAGIRPYPAVSVASENETKAAPTLT